MKKSLFCYVLFVMLLLTACGSKDNSSDVTIEELSDISDFDGYSLNDKAMLISEVKNIYQSKIDEVMQFTAQNSKLLFKDDSEFCALRDFDRLYLFEQDTSDRETTVGDAKEYFRKALDSLGYDSEQFLTENNTVIDYDEITYNLDSLNDSDLMSEKGGIWVLSTKECAFNLWPNGLYALSDGSICDFLGNETASEDFYGNFEFGETGVVKGSLEELSDESYPLIDKEATVGEMSEYAMDFVKTKDLLPYPDEIEMEICDVHVMTLNKIGYFSNNAYLC